MMIRQRRWVRQRGVGRWLAVLALIGLGTAGCNRKKTASDKVVETRRDAAAARGAAAGGPVMARLREIGAKCRVNVTHAVISNCENNEKQKLVRDYNTGKLSRVETLPGLIAGLESEDPNVVTAASKTLEGAFRNTLGKVQPGELSAELAERLLAVIPKLPKRQATQALPAAVHVAVLAGQVDALLELLSNQPDSALRASGYVHLMRYGGISLLPRVKQLVSDPDEKVAAAAVESLRRMSNKTDEEKAQVCGFAVSLLSDPRGAVAGKAGAIAVVCQGEVADAALDEVEKRYKAGALPGELVRSLDQLCLDRRGQRYGSEQQCDRTRALLQRLLVDTKLEGDVRTFALLGLGLQFPDSQTEALAKKYVADDFKRLSTSAQRIVRSIEMRRDREQKSAGKSAHPSKSPVSPSGPTNPTTKQPTPTAQPPSVTQQPKPAPVQPPPAP